MKTNSDEIIEDLKDLSSLFLKKKRIGINVQRFPEAKIKVPLGTSLFFFSLQFFNIFAKQK
jgi:hypothetical protein